MVKMYKGFNKDMTCNGFQYEEGKEYTCDEAQLCKCGFHACEMPLDCFRYYRPDKSVYYEVELSDIDERNGDDSKRCGKKIKIGAKLEIANIVRAQIEIVREHADNAGGNYSTNAGGNCSTNAGGNDSINAGGDWSTNAGGNDSTNAGGVNSLCVCWNGKCKGGVGSLLVIGHRYLRYGKWAVDGYAHGIVDGEKIKADTWYGYKDGELVEVADDE